MGKTFRLDGKSHVVCPDDVVVMEGPGHWISESYNITLEPGGTITMLLDGLAPGEAIRITLNPGPTTTFFRPRSVDESVHHKASVPTS